MGLATVGPLLPFELGIPFIAFQYVSVDTLLACLHFFLLSILLTLGNFKVDRRVNYDRQRVPIRIHKRRSESYL